MVPFIFSKSLQNWAFARVAGKNQMNARLFVLAKDLFLLACSHFEVWKLLASVNADKRSQLDGCIYIDVHFNP